MTELPENIKPEHWDLVIKYKGLLSRISNIYGLSRASDCLSDVLIPHFLSAIQRFDKTKGAFIPFVTRALKGAGASWRRGNLRREKRHLQYQYPQETDEPQSDIKGRLHLIMTGMSADDQYMLKCVYVCDWSFAQLADALGIDEKTAVRGLRHALKRAKEQANGR